MMVDIALSSEQNWANVQSILDRNEGPGRVFWLETYEAQSRRWTRGAKSLLESRGYQVEVFPFNELADVDPSTFHRQLSEVIATHLGADTVVHLHTNGGKKWMQSILSDVFRQAFVHYIELGDHLSRDIHGWHRQPTRTQPELTDILACYGYERKWPSWTIIGQALARSWHDPFRAFLQDRGVPRALRSPALAIFERQLPWFIQAAGLLECRTETRIPSAYPGLEQAFCLAFPGDSKLGLGGNAWSDFRTCWNWWWAETKLRRTPPQDSAGAPFEVITSELIRRYSDAWGVHRSYSNVDTEHPERPGQSFAEMDVLWLLRTGQAIVFECKALPSETKGLRKDLSGRIRNYRACLGSYVRCVLVWKVDHRFTPETMHSLRDTTDSLNMPEPLWVCGSHDRPYNVNDEFGTTIEILDPFMNQMETLKQSLRIG